MTDDTKREPTVVQGFIEFPGNGGKPSVWKRGDNETQKVRDKQIHPDFLTEYQRLKAGYKKERIAVQFISQGPPNEIRRPVVVVPVPPFRPTLLTERVSGDDGANAANAIPHVQRSPVNGTTSGEDPYPMGFHHAYNFIQALSRQNVPSKPAVPQGLGDGRPFGHHALHESLYTGTIDVTLTTATPLLISDAENQEEHPNDMNHPVFSVRKRSGSSEPYLSPSSIKGVLSAEYEAVTNSRLRIVRGHDRRLAFRREAKVNVEPFIVIESAPDRLTLQPLKLAKLRTYSLESTGKDRGRSSNAMRYVGTNDLPKHLDHVRVQTDEYEKVTSIERFDPKSTSSGREGWVLLNNANISNKGFERVFISTPGGLLTLNGTAAQEAKRLWEDLISDYQTIHAEDLRIRAANGTAPRDYLGHEPGRTAWSRHVYSEVDKTLQKGMLIYVARSGDNVSGIFPVAISRELFQKSPAEITHPSLRPASSLDELSPADRVFGWTHASAETARAKDPNAVVAHKGHLRIGKVTCSKDAITSFEDNRIPLAILSSPKPSQASFYTSESNGQPVNVKNNGYRQGQQIRHRKVYLHHKSVTGDTGYWSKDRSAASAKVQEFRPPEGADRGGISDQNRSIAEWVKVGTTFSFRIHITNLSEVELGAMLWMLSLDQQYPDQKHFHRMGGGKPLGFGSVSAQITSTDLRTGNEWQAYYGNLNDDADAVDAVAQNVALSAAIEAYKVALVHAYKPRSLFESVEFIDAFLACARGFDGPVHYPRMREIPDKDGKNFEWFGKAQTANPKVPLPRLSSASHHLPYGNQIQ